MKLTAEQIRSITKGAARIEEKDGRIEFFRFTEAEEAMYLEQSPNDFYKKTFCTAGIRLEFDTDSCFLTLSAEVSAVSGTKFFGYDVYVGGKLLGQVGGQLGTTPSEEVSGRFCLGYGQKRVTVYMPWSVNSKLIELSLDDGASLAPVAKERRMLLFGDSITHGYITTEPARSYASLLTDALCAEARNKAIGGEFFRPDLAACRNSDFEPDMITVAYGTNDWSKRKKELFDATCRDFYRVLSETYPAAKIFALTPIWRADYEQTTKDVGPFSYVEEYIKEVTKDLPNVTVIRGFDLVPHDIRYYWDYYLHPNAAGFEHYFKNLLAEIQKYL